MSLSPEKQKTRYWSKTALSVLGGMRQHKKTEQITTDRESGTRPWGNVTEHCLVEVTRAEVLGRLLRLPENIITDMKTAAVLHDFSKKQEIEATREATKKGESALQAYKNNSAEAERQLQKAGFNQRVVRLAGAAGGHTAQLFETYRIVSQPTLTEEDWAYLILHYVDDCSTGSDWVRPHQIDKTGKKTNIIDFRAEENKAKPAYRGISQGIGEELKGHPVFGGMNNHDAMTLVSHLIEQRLAQTIQQKTGKHIDPILIPELVDQKIAHVISRF